MTRPIHRLGLLVSFAALVAACDDGSTSTTEGGGGDGGNTTTSMTSASGGAPTGGGGTGGMPTGGGGTGGMPTGGGGTGGMPTGGGGTGGMMVTEICGNMVDDDGDMAVDCDDDECANARSCSKLVINEVDYDNPMTDTAEFIEILNTGMSDVDLTGLQVVFVNGSDTLVYNQVDLMGALAPGGYLVVAGTDVMGIDPAAIVVPMPEADSNLQNGGNMMADGVAIYDTLSKTVVDALSYEGSLTMASIDGGTFNLVSGTVTPALDDGYPGKSLIRFPNGQNLGDDSVDWTATWTPTPGTANVATEVCDDALDNDKNGQVDCADPACNDTPECPEVCDNGMDDDGDMLVDCADLFCAGQMCNMFGSMCVAGACACPGGNVENACQGGMDDDCDGMIDCADADCAAAPACVGLTISTVDYGVITHGGKLVISGAGFMGATMVTIGGMSVMFTVESNNQITLANIPDNVPLGNQNIVVTTAGGSSMPYQVTVIHLLINELDADQVMTDAAEFVEISTGVPSVSLAGYTLVMWNGNGDTSYLSLNLDGTTDANGLLLAGNTGLMPAPSMNCTWPNSTLQNGQDAISVHQALPASFPSSTAVGAMITGATLIDAVVYDTADADDDGLLDALIGPAGTLGRVQVDEGANPMSETQSIQRCGDGRRRGDKFAIGAPTPGAANTVAACP